MSKQKVSFYTQGCRLNIAETAAITESFSHHNYDVVPFKDSSDIVVVNTCVVTEKGESDLRRLTRKINRENPEAKIALVGCQSQILKEKLLTYKNVQWVIGNSEKDNLVQHILDHPDTTLVHTPKLKKESFTLPYDSVDAKHKRANLKIQDGCDFYCSFCIIPFARGPARSRVFEDIIREAINLCDYGHKELVLTGINLGTYSYEDKGLIDIIQALEKLPKCQRIRISSIEPTTIPIEILDIMAKPNSKLCPYLHIPIQSGCDSVLKTMRRHHSVKDVTDFIRLAKKKVPDICIGTDVIVGFPGESKADFDRTVACLMTAPFDYFHVFSYSERSMARSRKFDDQVDKNEIKRRSEVLRTISDTKKERYSKTFLNSQQDVLFEQKKHDVWTGLTKHFVKVQVQSESDLSNQILPVTLSSFNEQTSTMQSKIIT